MKNAVFTIIILSAHHSFALSDLERGLIFVANAGSGGTYLAGIESQKAKIAMEYQVQTSEFKLLAEKDSKQALRALLQQEIVRQEKRRSDMTVILEVAHGRQRSLAQMRDNIGAVIKSKKSLAEIEPQLLGTEWDEIRPNISSPEDFNSALQKALDLEKESEEAVGSIRGRIVHIESTIELINLRLGELK